MVNVRFIMSIGSISCEHMFTVPVLSKTVNTRGTLGFYSQPYLVFSNLKYRNSTI